MVSQPIGQKISLVRVADRWRVFLNNEDLGASFQFPWDALQCAVNGSLTGKPISDIQTIEVLCSSEPDVDKVRRTIEAEEKQRALIASLRGTDGDGI
jgi:hypothetical protein